MDAAMFWFLLAVAPSAPDTLVVCAAELRPALAAWEEHRRRQGHEILFIEPPATPADLSASIRAAAQSGRLKYLLLVGDVPGASTLPENGLDDCIPTHYVEARINTRWGSEPTIATDTPYSDVDGDGSPDLAIGRIAADSIDELAAVVGKILNYERGDSGDWQRRLNVIVGAGGFGKVTDAIIEAAGRYVFQQAVPGEYEVRHTAVHASSSSTPRLDRRSQIREQLDAGSLAWIYLGHGLPTELDRVSAGVGKVSLFSVSDVADLRCGCRTPLAVLVACYTGAIDAPHDCLAEELSLAGDGPVAVIAATRVTMPYGNTVLGYELLRACFENDCGPAIGDVLLVAQQRTRRDGAGDPIRESLDAMCRGLSPPPVDLAAERAEHVLMYHLLGDPLLRLRMPTLNVAQSEPGVLSK